MRATPPDGHSRDARAETTPWRKRRLWVGTLADRLPIGGVELADDIRARSGAAAHLEWEADRKVRGGDLAFSGQDPEH